MIIHKNIEEMRNWRKKQSGNVGFVPTMGSLHEGHASLIRHSLADCAVNVVSIFVNPTQFLPHEDFDTYPRVPDADIALCNELGVDAVFLPEAHEIYPPDFSFFVDENEISRQLEGKSRPGFFRGVATVVLKFFNLVQPTHVYFGEKDAQQLRVIQKMVRDLDLPLKIIPCPIVREANGLAMSSRNERLSQDARKRAAIVNESLQFIVQEAMMDSECDELRQIFIARVETDTLAKVDYISIADDRTLKELDGPIESAALFSCAVYFDGVRLIDNIRLAPACTL